MLITILHLYPEELNIYGDRGNIMALVRRLEWRGYTAKLVYAGVNQPADIAAADIIFGGGGQDRGQLAVGKDLQRHSAALHLSRDNGVPMLTICGTYQLFGTGFTTLNGIEIPGIGLFNARTLGSNQRMIGNVIIDTQFGRMAGFENHSGKTMLGDTAVALGTVVQGYGNDGASGAEGIRSSQAFGTYLHGPVLPKNPVFTDHLILTALKNKYNIDELEPLHDNLEQLAAADASRRPQ